MFYFTILKMECGIFNNIRVILQMVQGVLNNTLSKIKSTYSCKKLLYQQSNKDNRYYASKARFYITTTHKTSSPNKNH